MRPLGHQAAWLACLHLRLWQVLISRLCQFALSISDSSDPAAASEAKKKDEESEQSGRLLQAKWIHGVNDHSGCVREVLYSPCFAPPIPQGADENPGPSTSGRSGDTPLMAKVRAIVAERIKKYKGPVEEVRIWS